MEGTLLLEYFTSPNIITANVVNEASSARSGGEKMEPTASNMDMEELKAYNEAMEMNRQLKAMLQETEQQTPHERVPLRQHPQQQARGGAPAPVRKKTSPGRGQSGAPASGAGARNFTFSEQRLNSMGRENQVLLERMQRIALSSGTGLSSQPVAASYRRKVGSNGINRQRKDKRVQSENMVHTRGRMRTCSPAHTCSALVSTHSSHLRACDTTFTNFPFSRPFSSACSQ